MEQSLLTENIKRFKVVFTWIFGDPYGRPEDSFRKNCGNMRTQGNFRSEQGPPRRPSKGDSPFLLNINN